MRTSIPVQLFLLATCVYGLPEIAIQRRDRHNHGDTADVARGVVKRQEGTLETNVFNIITYTTGGAYYANGAHWVARRVRKVAPSLTYFAQSRLAHPARNKR